jgi:5,10-methylenetetrahydrofolate reductase
VTAFFDFERPSGFQYLSFSGTFKHTMQKFEELFSLPHVVFDGGIATELYERGFYINRPFEELNLTHPRDVSSVHESYIDAGSHMVTTNTFSLVSPQLEKFDLKDRQRELLHAAINAAVSAVKSKGGTTKVGLSLGPMSVLIEPLGPTSREEVREEYQTLSKYAVENAGHDFYILETFSNLDELEAAIDGIRRTDQTRPILASITTMSSETAFIQSFGARISARGDVQALGMNCSEGPHDLLQSLKVLKPATHLPIIIQPNAGIPRSVNGRYFYMTSPDYLAKFAKRFIESGAFGVGGCCGTGPDHIRAISSSVKMMGAMSMGVVISESPRITIETKAAAPVRTLYERTDSKIGAKLKTGKKVISIELTSPRGTDLTKFLQQIEQVKNAKVDFVNVPDGARAATRSSSLHLAAYVNSRKDLGVTIVPHLTTRDRNLIALQADLLGSSINQVHDLLIVTGDPPKLGNSRDATAVYDIDSIGLTYLVNRLNQGLSPQGDHLGSSTGFGIGVASNPTAINLELEISRWKYKVESGADYAFTQPLYEEETFFRWKDKIQSSYRPHIVGIWPFVSYKNAEFMAHEVPGVHVPKWALEKMSAVQDDPVASVRTGIEIAAHTMKKLWNECEGFAISAPLGRVEVALEVLKCLE